MIKVTIENMAFILILIEKENIFIKNLYSYWDILCTILFLCNLKIYVH